MWSVACLHRVHSCRLSRVQDPLEVGCGPLVVCSLLLSALSLCLWCIVFEYALISRFKGVFSGFPLLDVCLYCSRALRGLWGFCVREWLGGFMSCCVFSSFYPFICLSFCLFALGFILLPCLSAFRLSSSICPLCLPCLFLCPCGLLLFLFPLRMNRQKERARRVGASSLVLLCVFRCLYSY